MTGEQFISDQLSSTTLLTLDAVTNVRKHLGEVKPVSLKQIRANYSKAIQLALFVTASLMDRKELESIVSMKEFLLSKKENIYSSSARFTTYAKLGLYKQNLKGRGLVVDKNDLVNRLLVPVAVITDELNIQSIFGSRDSSFDWSRKREPVFNFLLSKKEIITDLWCRGRVSKSVANDGFQELINSAKTEFETLEGVGASWRKNQADAQQKVSKYMDELKKHLENYLGFSDEVSPPTSSSSDEANAADNSAETVAAKRRHASDSQVGSGSTWALFTYVLKELSKQLQDAIDETDPQLRLAKTSVVVRRIFNTIVRSMQSFYDPGVDEWLQKNRYLILEGKAALNSRAYDVLFYIMRTPLAIVIVGGIAGLIVGIVCVLCLNVKESDMPFCVLFLHLKGDMTAEEAKPVYLVTTVAFLVVVLISLIALICVRALMINDRKRCTSENLCASVVNDFEYRTLEMMSKNVEELPKEINTIAVSVLVQDRNFLENIEANIVGKQGNSRKELAKSVGPLVIDADNGRQEMVKHILAPSLGAEAQLIENLQSELKKSDIGAIKNVCKEVLQIGRGQSRTFADSFKEFFGITPKGWLQCAKGQKIGQAVSANI